MKRDRLLDNDVVKKLCQYQLEEEFCDVCCPSVQIAVLPTLKFVFQLNDDALAHDILQTHDAVVRVRKFLDEVSEIEDSSIPDELQHQYDELLAEFQDIDQIDSGEAILFALTILVDSTITFTGDKRSIIALGNILNEENRAKVTGRVKCLEQTIAELMLNMEFQEMSKKVANKPWDTALRACFGSTSYESVIEGLESYYYDLNNGCNNLLAPFPT